MTFSKTLSIDLCPSIWRSPTLLPRYARRLMWRRRAWQWRRGRSRLAWSWAYRSAGPRSQCSCGSPSQPSFAFKSWVHGVGHVKNGLAGNCGFSNSLGAEADRVDLQFVPVDVVDLLEYVVHVPHLHRPVDRRRHHRVPCAHGQRLMDNGNGLISKYPGVKSRTYRIIHIRFKEVFSLHSRHQSCPPEYQWCERSARRDIWQGPPSTWTRCTALFWFLWWDICKLRSTFSLYLVLLPWIRQSVTAAQSVQVQTCDGVNMAGTEYTRVGLVRLGRDVSDSRRKPQCRASGKSQWMSLWAKTMDKKN